ncbi:MAG: pyruvate, phosphate dikinase/phosphoenolpyruvate synthase regulator, partial [Pseudomonadota bacterium]
MVETAADRARTGAATFFHVHLVSDATGETLTAVLKAAISQFRNVNAIEHIFALVRSPQQLDRALVEIEASPGLVMYTLMKPDLRRRLEVACSQLQIPAIPVLDPALSAFTSFLGLEQTQRSGAQHALDDEYFRRIEALDYTLAHDDGQLGWDLDVADVVLLGPSRTSKTPTCMYLANRGVRAANIPLVPGAELPAQLFEAQR